MSYQHFDNQAILEAEKGFRTNLINSFSGFRSPVLVGTRGLDARSNLAIFSQVLHVGANPPLIGILFRPDTVARHTLENIRQTGFYTLNHVAEAWYQQAHQTSARYGEESEFTATGLHEEAWGEFPAPFVRESLVKAGLEVKEEYYLEINGTILVVGEVQHLLVSPRLLQSDGTVSHGEAQHVAVAGLDAYFSVEPLARLSYAKPDRPVQKI